MLLHFCLSISIISKISRSQTTRVATRPFVSFASAKVGKNHPNFQIYTQIHTTTRQFSDQFARVHYMYSYHEAGEIFLPPNTPHSTPKQRTKHTPRGLHLPISMNETVAASPVLYLECQGIACPAPRYASPKRHTSPSPYRAYSSFIQRRKKHRPREGKAPSRSAFPLSMYVVLKTRHVNPNIHVRRY